MAKTIKLSDEKEQEGTTIELVVAACSPYGNEGDIITVNVVDSASMIEKGFAKKEGKK